MDVWTGAVFLQRPLWGKKAEDTWYWNVHLGATTCEKGERDVSQMNWVV